MRSTPCTFTKQTMGRVRRRTSTKQRSMTLVVRSLRHRCRGNAKNDSNSGSNPTPTFTFTAKDTFVPSPTVIDGVWYQVDTWQGKWRAAKSMGASTYKGRVTSALTLGMHVLYAYATDGQEATDTSTDQGTSPLVCNIAAYPFLMY
jgi:hypothetical protein